MAEASPSQLVQYVKGTLRQGYSEQQVRQTLLQNGYDQASVDQAFSLAKGERQQGPARPASSRTNRLGIVAFVLAFVGPLFIGASPSFFLQGVVTPVLAGLGVLAVLATLILGIVSLRQVRRRGEKGKVLSILSIIFGGLQVLGVILLVVGLFFMRSLFSAGADSMGGLLESQSVQGSVDGADSGDALSGLMESPDLGCKEAGGRCLTQEICDATNGTVLDSFNEGCKDDGESYVCCESSSG
ncbi:MAG: hypothetical protein ACLFO2_00600 [Candidatus Woesearchaeota archaeon]